MCSTLHRIFLCFRYYHPQRRHFCRNIMEHSSCSRFMSRNSRIYQQQSRKASSMENGRLLPLAGLQFLHRFRCFRRNNRRGAEHFFQYYKHIQVQREKSVGFILDSKKALRVEVLFVLGNNSNFDKMHPYLPKVNPLQEFCTP